MKISARLSPTTIPSPSPSGRGGQGVRGGMSPAINTMAYLGKSKENAYFYNSSKGSFENAKKLRSRQTDAETLLWEALRNRQINGLKFRRQHPVSSFIADFYCHEVQLIIELDGSIHDDPEVADRDEIRTNVFKEKELKVIRFKNEEVLTDLKTVLFEIRKACGVEAPHPPTPSPGGRGGGDDE